MTTEDLKSMVGGFQINVMRNNLMKDGVGILLLSPNDYDNYIKTLPDKKELEDNGSKLTDLTIT